MKRSAPILFATVLAACGHRPSPKPAAGDDSLIVRLHFEADRGAVRAAWGCAVAALVDHDDDALTACVTAASAQLVRGIATAAAQPAPTDHLTDIDRMFDPAPAAPAVPMAVLIPAGTLASITWPTTDRAEATVRDADGHTTTIHFIKEEGRRWKLDLIATLAP